METDKQIIHEAIKSIECPQDLNVVESSLIDEYHYFPYTDPRVNILGYPEIKHDKDEHDAVDLGLSVLWATCNIGATKPSDYGDYYAGGELYTKDDYSVETYTYTDNPGILPSSNDVATQKIGSDWRIPTNNDIDELIDTYVNSNYQWTWKSIDGNNGWEITYLINNNSIFLPAAGYRDGTSLHDVGSDGYCWSSILKTSSSNRAWMVCFGSGDIWRDDSSYRYIGRSIRPVKQK